MPQIRDRMEVCESSMPFKIMHQQDVSGHSCTFSSDNIENYHPRKPISLAMERVYNKDTIFFLPINEGKVASKNTMIQKGSWFSMDNPTCQTSYFRLPTPKWNLFACLSLKAYSRRKGPKGEFTRIPIPYPYPLPGLYLAPAGLPKKHKRKFREKKEYLKGRNFKSIKLVLRADKTNPNT